jgi:tetrahydromethanopterin S-methyltransferase subunit A
VTDTGSGRNAEAIQATRGKERASNGGDDKVINDVVSNAGIKFVLSHYIY